MKIEPQDYLFSFAMALKTIAMLITVYTLDRYAGLLYERNAVTRLLLQNDLAFYLWELAVFAFICIGYYCVRSRYVLNHEKRSVRWSFNAVVCFVFLTSLWDAGNDVLILMTTSLSKVQG
jgi:hypothetical protein